MADMELVFREDNHSIIRLNGKQYDLFKMGPCAMQIVNDVGEHLQIEWAIGLNTRFICKKRKK